MDNVATACTDGKTIVLNTDFMLGLSTPERNFIIEHELMHAITAELHLTELFVRSAWLNVEPDQCE